MAFVQHLAILFTIAFIAASASASTVGWKGRANLPPAPGKTGPEAVLIFIQGAQVPGLQYTDLLARIQNTSSLKLWASSSDFVGDLPNPLGIAYEVSKSLSDLAALNMPANLPVVVAGHSLGGIVIQDWVAANNGNIDGQPRVKATLLLGSFLQRKYNATLFPTPVLQLAGTLDGLTRVTRLMESFYHANMNVTDAQAAMNPVVALSGVSHAQYFDGDVPHLVKERDLKPEASVDEARKSVRLTFFLDCNVFGVILNKLFAVLSQIAIVTSNFMQQILTPAPGNAAFVKITLDLVKKSGEFFAPLLNAFYQEGYAFFRMPCNLVNNTPGCMPGCPWTEYAQALMAGEVGTGFELLDHDDFHRVYHLPDVKLPQIDNNCTAPANCKLLTKTVTQGVYSVPTWETDTAFFPQSADELRAKMSSRQRVYIAAGVANANFDALDGGDWCKFLNQIAYDWARNHSDALTLKRFDAVGEPLVMGADKVESSGGPSWIWSGLEFHDTVVNGTLVNIVRSPMMKTSMDYWIKFSRGFHYCKLLSPARAMEWIYVDGLRAHNHI